jgi:catechol 1,2-dioxygenase
LIGEVRFIDDAQSSAKRGVEGRFAELSFDFQLQPAEAVTQEQRSLRPRVLQD